NVFVPVTFFPRFFVTNSSTFSGSRFHTATGNPCSSMLSARFSPITPNPIIPNCACAIAKPFCVCHSERKRGTGVGVRHEAADSYLPPTPLPHYARDDIVFV